MIRSVSVALGTSFDLGPVGGDGDGASVHAVHERLRQAILRGDLPPDSVVSQVDLADQLGVSRTPLREALRLLQREELIESAPHRRVQIAGVSPRDVEEIYLMRLALESAALRISVPRLSPEEIGKLEGSLAEMGHFASLLDYERWEVPHRAFHLGLVAKSGRRMVATLSELHDHAERCRRLAMRTPRAWKRGSAEHRAILDTAKARDLDGCVAALVAHLGHTALSVLAPDHQAPLLRETALHLTGRALELEPEEL